MFKNLLMRFAPGILAHIITKLDNQQAIELGAKAGRIISKNFRRAGGPVGGEKVEKAVQEKLKNLVKGINMGADEDDNL